MNPSAVDSERDKNIATGIKTLIVSADGTDVRALIPPNAWAHGVHTYSLVQPQPCQCGATHASGPDVDMLVFVGEPLGHVDLYRRRVGIGTVAIVPRSAEDVDLGCGKVVVGVPDRWRETAAAVVRHLLEGLHGDGLIGYRAEDLAAILRAGPDFLFAEASTSEAIRAAHDTLAQVPPGPLGSCHLGIRIPRTGTLHDVGVIMELVFGRLAPDADGLAYAVVHDTATTINVSLLVGSPRGSNG